MYDNNLNESIEYIKYSKMKMRIVKMKNFVF